jgi:hypothetical protein
MEEKISVPNPKKLVALYVNLQLSNVINFNYIVTMHIVIINLLLAVYGK